MLKMRTSRINRAASASLYGPQMTIPPVRLASSLLPPRTATSSVCRFADELHVIETISVKIVLGKEEVRAL